MRENYHFLGTDVNNCTSACVGDVKGFYGMQSSNKLIVCSRYITGNSTLSQPGGGGYSHTLTIRVCAAGQGMVFKPSNLKRGI